jgi:hypothetical protein
MFTQFFYAGLLLIIGFIIIITNHKYGMLRDKATAGIIAPYSYSRVQLAWWIVIFLASFFATMFIKQKFPNIDPSILMLVGLTGVISASSSVVEKGELTSLVSKGFWTDIINGGDPHRLFTVFVNIGVGSFFIYQVFTNLVTATIADNVMPIIPNQILELLGVSGGLYITGKAIIEK